MDRIVLAAGTALVGAIASDTWQQVRGAIVGLWRRAHPRRQVDDVCAEHGTRRAHLAGITANPDGSW
jgi:hypothetical protein